MINLPFCLPVYFTPESHPTLREKWASRIDDYFHLCGPVFKTTSLRDFNNPWAYNGSIVNQSEAPLYSKNITNLLMILKIISYVTVIIPLIMLLAKYLLRFPYRLSLLFPESSFLSKTTKKEWLSKEELAYIKLQLPKALPQSLKKAPHSLIKCYHTSSDSTAVFELKKLPHLIFKISDDNSDLKTRIQKMQLIKRIIKENNYDKLICPASHLLQISLENKKIQYCVIEQKIQIPEEHKKNELGWPITPGEYGWTNHDEDLRPAIAQATQVIQKTGLSDIFSRNLPAILNNDIWKICLLDTDLFRSSPDMVSYNLRQLINCCFSQKSIDAVIDASNPQALPERLQTYFSEDVQTAKKDRLNTLNELNASKSSYLQMQKTLGNINDPYKPISVDIKLLGLDLTQTALNPNNTKASIITIINKVIAALNQSLKINKTKVNQKYHNHRKITFNIHIYNKETNNYHPHVNTVWPISCEKAPPLLNLLGLNPEEIKNFKTQLSLTEKAYSTSSDSYTKALEYQQKTWLCQIMTALQEKGFIFSSDYLINGNPDLVFSGHFSVCL